MLRHVLSCCLGISLACGAWADPYHCYAGKVHAIEGQTIWVSNGTMVYPVPLAAANFQVGGVQVNLSSLQPGMPVNVYSPMVLQPVPVQRAPVYQPVVIQQPVIVQPQPVYYKVNPGKGHDKHHGHDHDDH